MRFVGQLQNLLQQQRVLGHALKRFDLQVSSGQRQRERRAKPDLQRLHVDQRRVDVASRLLAVRRKRRLSQRNVAQHFAGALGSRHRRADDVLRALRESADKERANRFKAAETNRTNDQRGQ